jgi:repressor LexA
MHVMADYQLAVVRDGQAHWSTATMVGQPRLTPRQHAILEYIRAHISAHGYPPTVRQIAGAVGLASTSAVSYQLGRLEHKHALRRQAHLIRGVRLTDRSTATPSSTGELFLIPGGMP